MSVDNSLICLNCNGKLRYYDSVRRLVKTKGGAKQWIKIKRFRCINCRALHRKLPDNILPFKQYESKIIFGVINGDITPDTLGYEDYPCEMTMQRWSRKIHVPL